MKFSANYFIRTERLGMRPWWDGDLELAYGLWGDERVTALIGGPFTQAQIRERLCAEIEADRAQGVQHWPVFRLSDDLHVGCCGLRPYQGSKDVLELGCHIRFEHWRQGYAAEAARGVVQYALEKLGARELFVGHHPNNHASERVIKKLGFEYVQHELFPATGLMHPSYRLKKSG
ncbi:MAG TPA: GNAT family N-acetyltransferase [Planctomycetota bacterium]|nr:GNAT family N-acetyltransferase [Planctomycetota bacterium]